MKPFATALLVAAWAAHPALATDWPTVRVPDGIRAESVGEDMALNGRATRISRFQTAVDCKAAQAAFRNFFGERRVEAIWLGRWTVGQVERGYLTTVQLAPTRLGCAGTIATSRLAPDPGAKAKAWPLPAGSVPLSDLVSRDGGRRSRQVLARNGHSLALNEAHFVRLLRMLEMAPIEREGDARRRVVWFSGRGGDGLLTLDRNGEMTDIALTVMEGS